MPTIIPPGGGEVIGDAPDRRVEILSDVDVLHATWSRFGPGREGADLHVHRRHSDLFYVLAGELTVRLGPEGGAVAAPAGKLARVPPLVVHGFRNAGDAELRYLNLHAPGVGFADYMRALRDGRTLAYDQYPPPADGGRPAADAVVAGDPFVADQAGVPVALLADVDEIAVVEVSPAGGSPSPARHLHRHHAESFYVLEGELAITLGDGELRARPGSWVQVPPGLPHTVSYPERVRFLAVHTPNCGFGAFLRALSETGGDAPAVARSGFDEEPAPGPVKPS